MEGALRAEADCVYFVGFILSTKSKSKRMKKQVLEFASAVIALNWKVVHVLGVYVFVADSAADEQRWQDTIWNVYEFRVEL